MEVRGYAVQQYHHDYNIQPLNRIVHGQISRDTPRNASRQITVSRHRVSEALPRCVQSLCLRLIHNKAGTKICAPLTSQACATAWNVPRVPRTFTGM
jgi:hypothetical protein